MVRCYLFQGEIIKQYSIFLLCYYTENPTPFSMSVLKVLPAFHKLETDFHEVGKTLWGLRVKNMRLKPLLSPSTEPFLLHN